MQQTTFSIIACLQYAFSTTYTMLKIPSKTSLLLLQLIFALSHQHDHKNETETDFLEEEFGIGEDSTPLFIKIKVRSTKLNYGHADFSIGLLRDTKPHVDSQLMTYGAKHPFLWP